MRFEYMSLFLLLINTIEDAGLSSNSVKLGERNFEDEFDENAFKELGKALQNTKLTDQHQQTLDNLGKAIISGSISDKNHPEHFKLLGKAIAEKKLNEEAKKLLGKLLENGRDEDTYAQLRKILVKNNNSSTLNQQGHSENQKNAPVSTSHDNIKISQESYSVDDNDAFINELLKNVNISEANKDEVINLIVQALGYKNLLNDENRENLNLSKEALTLSEILEVKYPITLKLLREAIGLKKYSEDRIKEILKYLLNVFITEKPSDDDAHKQLAEMLVNTKLLDNNDSGAHAPRKEIDHKNMEHLSNNHLIEDSSENDRIKKQVTHVENNGPSDKRDSKTVNQNAENASIKTTKSAEPKKRSKRNSKSHLKSNSDSHQSKDKSKKSREKLLKKNKRSRRSTKNITKSKNKHKRSKRKKSKEKTAISGHDGVSNSKDLDMMGNDPNTYNASTHSETPITKTVGTKPKVINPKTNAQSSTSNKNDNSKLFNSYYPEEYKRFVPLNPAIAYRRPKQLFLNDDNQTAPMLKTVVGGQSQGDNFEDDVKPQKIIEVPKSPYS